MSENKTTVDKVKLTAKELASLSNEAIQLFIDDSWVEITKRGFPEDIQEKACRYLACHYGVMNNQNIKAEQVGPLKREYSGYHSTFKDLNRSTYGQEYARLLKEYGNGGKIVNLMVM